MLDRNAQTTAALRAQGQTPNIIDQPVNRSAAVPETADRMNAGKPGFDARGWALDPRNASEVERLKTRNLELCEENAGLAGEIGDLRGQLAELRSFGPYDSATDVLEVLVAGLPGWPAKRWRALARLLEQRVTADGPV